jgi:hypothetical protein
MTELCGDDALGYLRSRTTFAPRQGLALDETYRLAHLPLIAPESPRVIARREGTHYEMGRHPPVFSLVLPVPGEALAASAAYRELTDELRAAPFAGKLAWRLLQRRQGKLHATVCGSLATGAPPVITDDQRHALMRAGPIEVELRGLFSGNVNVGRLYLRAYPQKRDGVNAFHLIQRAMGRRATDLHVVGLHNLLDDLDVPEAAALGMLIERWWDRPLLRFTADRLWLLGSQDDLVLDSAVVETLPLARP